MFKRVKKQEPFIFIIIVQARVGPAPSSCVVPIREQTQTEHKKVSVFQFRRHFLTNKIYGEY